MLEKEFKALIDEKQYEELLNLFPASATNEQKNTYYTSLDNLLKKNGITFRIRTIDGVNKVQVKRHIKNQTSLQISEESEFDISDIPTDFSEDEIFGYTGIKTSASLIGELTTLRSSYMYSDGVEICIDKSSYLNRTDYEIEIEYTRPIPEELMKKLSEIGIDFDKPCCGKFSRFMNRLMG